VFTIPILAFTMPIQAFTMDRSRCSRSAARAREVNELDGVHGSVIYPTEGLRLFLVPDADLLTAVFRAYNDWVVDFGRAVPRSRYSTYPSCLTPVVTYDNVSRWYETLGRYRGSRPPGRTSRAFQSECRTRCSAP